jgi:uncharacterized Tic20 family protein
MAMTTKNNTTSYTDTEMLSILAHALGIITGFLGPLIILLMTSDTNVKNHAKKALNWQITFLIIFIILFMTLFVSFFLIFINPFFFIVYFLLFIPVFALSIANLILCIIAALKASKGELWNYPLSFPFFKTE